MRLNSDRSRRHAGGRPKTADIYRLGAVTWYWGVCAAARIKGATSDHAIEKLVAAFHSNLDLRDWIKSNSFPKYQRGQVPKPDTAENVEAVFPDTRVWLTLPLWTMSQVPLPSLERIHALLTELRSDITELLFSHVSNERKLVRQHYHSDRTYDQLDQMNDVEALSACIGLCREAEHDDNPYQHCLAGIKAINIFERLAAFSPLTYTASAIFQCWRETIFAPSVFEHWGKLDLDTPHGHFDGLDLNARLDRVNLEWSIEFYQHILLMLEDCCLLEFNDATYRACLYLVDRYGRQKAYKELWGAYQSGDLASIKSLPFCKYLRRRLRSFPFTVSIVDRRMTAH